MPKESLWARSLLVCSLIFVLFAHDSCFGVSITAVWNPSPSDWTAGYHLFYGGASGDYTTVMDAGTNTSLAVSDLAPGQTYYFASTGYDTNGDDGPYSNEYVYTVPSPPLLLTQPASLTVCAGTLADLFVNAESAFPMRFQWYFGTTAISEATNAQLILPQTSLSAAGSYHVVVADSYGSVTSAVAVLAVLSQPTNSYANAAGTYNGLFYQLNGDGTPNISGATSGLLQNCLIRAGGYYSAVLVCAGNSFPISGDLSAAGNGLYIVSRSSIGQSNLSVTLQLDWTGAAGQLTGVVSNMDPRNPWVSPLTATMSAKLYLTLAPLEFVSPAVNGQTSSTYDCWLTILPTAAVSFLGQLGDGTTFSESTTMGVNSAFPVYASLYQNTGVLEGWVAMSAGLPHGNLSWIQPANASNNLAGFTNIISFASATNGVSSVFQLIP